jgi:hypothetical protein
VAHHGAFDVQPILTVMPPPTVFPPAEPKPDGRVEPRSLGSGVRRDEHLDCENVWDVSVNTVQSA